MAQQLASVRELAKALSNINEMSQNISAATEEQTSNAKQVSKAVESVNDVTQAAAASAEEMSGATDEMSRLALALLGLVEKFRIANAAEVAGLGEALPLASASPSPQPPKENPPLIN